MANLKRLGQAEDKFKKMSIVHDLTQKERQKSREKWKEANEKNKALGSGDENSTEEGKKLGTY